MANLLALLAVGSILVTLTQCAFPNIDCVDRYVNGSALAGPCGPHGERCQFTDPTNVFIIGCNDDCMANHNAASGSCDAYGVCVCGPNEQVRHPGESSIQCLDDQKQQWFDRICDEDCKCAHNAFFGRCNYKTQACECRGRFRNGASRCPYANGNEFFLGTGVYYQKIGMSVHQFVNGYGK